MSKRVGLGITAALVAYSCQGGSVSPPENVSWVEVGPYDPEDGMNVRLHDLVMLPSASVATLAEDEIPIRAGPKIDELGRTIVTIFSTGKLAASLVRWGFVAEGHRELIHGDIVDGESTTSAATHGTCGAWPVTNHYFAPFDHDSNAFRGGLQTEIQAMANAHIQVITLGTTFENRPILAVKMGGGGSPSPTVYVVATHHAREWAAEEVGIELTRWVADAVNGVAGSDQTLIPLLQKATMVFVPVLNPDGYQYTHTTFRDHRRNRSPTCASDPMLNGVDINRNYPTDWDTKADAISSDGCNDFYVGPSAGSELETKAAELLLSGKAFSRDGATNLQTQAASISYHSYGDLLLYPGGFKAQTDVNGPACNSESNCMVPDFSLYRLVFGDTENPILKDGNYPYPASMENNLYYTISGDFTRYATFTSPKALSMTAELTGEKIDFHVECEPNYPTIISGLVSQQKALVKRMLSDAPGLVSTTLNSALAPTRLGKLAPGLWDREASGTLTTSTARPRFVKPIWAAADPGTPIIASINGQHFNLNKARTGAQYNLQMLDLAVMSPNTPFCLPCSIVYRDTSTGNDSAVNCSGCIDLTDPGRLPHSGWDLKSGLRGGKQDYWWEPTVSATQDVVLTIPSGTPPSGVTSCSLMFTSEWTPDNTGEGPVILERLGSAGWTEIQRWPYSFADMGTPVVEDRSRRRLRSEAIEANAHLPASTDEFRFRIPKGSTQPSFMLFDPAVYCRYGTLP
jgi:hypothetical protein